MKMMSHYLFVQTAYLNNESDQDGEAEHKLFCCLVLFWGFDEQ